MGTHKDAHNFTDTIQSHAKLTRRLKMQKAEFNFLNFWGTPDATKDPGSIFSLGARALVHCSKKQKAESRKHESFILENFESNSKRVKLKHFDLWHFLCRCRCTEGFDLDPLVQNKQPKRIEIYNNRSRQYIIITTYPFVE